MAMRLGSGNVVFEPIEGWEKLPEGWSLIDVAGGVDSLPVADAVRVEHDCDPPDARRNLLEQFQHFGSQARLLDGEAGQVATRTGQALHPAKRNRITAADKDDGNRAGR